MEKAWSFYDVEEYLSPYRQYFSRSEARKLAAEYVKGLLLEGGRKSVEPMSQRLGVSTRSLQRLLTEIKWDHESVLQAYREYMYGRYADGNGVLVAGLSEFPKRGGHSVCVARQYSENTGRMMSCQMACDVIYVENRIAWPMAMELYVPRFWSRQRDAQSRIRRDKAGIPGNVRHQERWTLALDQISTIKDLGTANQVVSAGTAFGKFPEFCDELDETGQRFVVEVPDSFEIFVEKPVLSRAGQKTGKRGRPRKHGPVMDSDILPVKVSSVEMHPVENDSMQDAADSDVITDQQFLSSHKRVWPARGWRDGIVHKPLWLAGAQKTCSREAAFFLSNFSDDLHHEDLAIMDYAQKMAAVCRQGLKYDLGLVHHEGRSWTGWHRHVVLVFLAWGFALEIKRPA